MDEDIRNWLPIDPGFKGIRLPNPIGTNRCYLNSAVNAIFSIPRIDEILNENHPVHAKLKRIKSGLQQSTQVLRQTLNTVFHEGHEYYVKNSQHDVYQILRDVFSSFGNDEKSLKKVEEFICITCQTRHTKADQCTSPFLVDVTGSVKEAIFNYKEIKLVYCQYCGQNQEHNSNLSYEVNSSTQYICFKSLREANRAKNKWTTVDPILDINDQTYVASCVVTHTGRSINAGTQEKY